MLPPVNEDVRLHPAFQLHILADIEAIWSSSFRIMPINPPLPSSLECGDAGETAAPNRPTPPLASSVARNVPER